MAYSYASLAQASTELGQRLNDSASQFWTDAERQLYIIEALREWNAITAFWRAEFSLVLAQGTFWYDMSDVTAVPNSLIPFTVTQADLLNMMEYHLLEPVVGAGPWTGSAQFAISDLTAAIQRRRDEVISSTACTVSRLLNPAVVGRTFLPDNVIDIRRVAWLPTGSPAGYSNAVLWPDDTWAEDHYNPEYTITPPGTPSVYSRSAQPPLSFDVDIQPAVPGQYECLVTQTPASGLGIPDDWEWVIKWGALADLLSRESVAKDELRAKYCEVRYRRGMAMMMSAASVLNARHSNSPLEIDSVQNLDDWKPSWQSESQGPPQTLVTAGLNLIGISPASDATPRSIVITTVQNMPIPTDPGQYIQVGRGDYDAIIDQAQHIASFKMGGSEFMATLPLHERFLKQAGLYNSKLQELGQFQKDMYDLGRMQDDSNPVYADSSPADE